MLAMVELAEVPAAEVLATEAHLNSVHTVNASFADVVGIKKSSSCENIHTQK